MARLSDSDIVTIGIPVFNAAQTLCECIDSVLAQSFSHWELIITDDGSSDDSLQIAHGYQDERIRVVSDGQHHGISYRINQQVSMATGRYFARMDADDIMLPWRIERQVEYLSAHGEVDVVGSCALVFEGRRKEGNPGSSNVYFTQEAADYRVTHEATECRVMRPGRWQFIHPTVMGRTEWFRRHPYRPECDGCEDWDLWLRTRGDSVFANIDEPLMLYRVGPTFDKEKYLERRRRGRDVLRLDRAYHSTAQYYLRMADSYLKSAYAYLFR